LFLLRKNKAQVPALEKKSAFFPLLLRLLPAIAFKGHVLLLQWQQQASKLG